jgi:MATE family multidrug resistance protein
MNQRLLSFWRTYAFDFRKTIQLSFPVIVGQVGFILMGLIDNLMIGDLSFVHLSAASLANSIFFILTVIGMGIAIAITPLVAEADGAKKPELAGKYFRQGIWVALGVGAILLILILLAAELLPYLNQPEEEVPLAYDYLRILALSMLPLMVFRVGKQFCEGLSMTRPAMIVILIGLLINVGANWVLIYGKLGFPRMELSGAGYGTLFSRTIMMLLMMGYVFFAPKLKSYDLRRHWNQFLGPVIRKILKIGLPSGLQFFFEVGAFVGAAIIIGLMEDASAQRAAHQIALQLFAISFMIVTGISVGATIRVGNAMGRKDMPGVRRVGLAGIYLGVAFMTVSAGIFFLGRNWFPTFFVEEERVIRIAAQLMFFGVAFQLFDGVQAVAVGILRGIQDVNVPTLYSALAYWGLALPLGAVLGFLLDWQVYGVWSGLVVGLALASVIMTRRFLKLTKIPEPAEPSDSPLPTPEEIPVQAD